MSNKVIKYWQIGALILVIYMLFNLFLYGTSIGLVAFITDLLTCIQACMLIYMLQKVKTINYAIKIFESNDPDKKLNENTFKGWDNCALIYIVISMWMGITFNYKWTPKALSLDCVICLNYFFLLYIVKHMVKISIHILEEKDYEEEI